MKANREVGKPSRPGGAATPPRGYDNEKANEMKAKAKAKGKKDEDDERKGPPNRDGGPQGKAGKAPPKHAKK